ncbi:hypothetical protein POUND7_017011 [Theobroma cacao]
MTKAANERGLANFLIFPFLLTRILHNQIWISYSRHRTAKGSNNIVDEGIDFEQVDRESNWSISILHCCLIASDLDTNMLKMMDMFGRDDQIILSGIILYLGNMRLPEASHFPIWRSDGVIITILLHTGPVEFLYYWLHRALHHHYLYSRYHSHHHSSIVTEPITSVIHPFAEIISYFLLFMIPMLTTVSMGTASIVSLFGYISYIDFMNNMGHCNFEFTPKWVFSIFPLLKYFMYTPSTRFLGLQAPPGSHHGHVARHVLYLSRGQRGKINKLIEEAISEADRKGAKVLSLGLLNQACFFSDEELNGNAELYIQRHPKLKIKIVDGSSLAAAVVVNSIPEETRQVVLRGKLSKVAYAIALALCQKGVKIWLVGDGLTQEEQLKASQGTIFIPFSQFPPRKVREDCYYHSTPAMVAPKSLENMHSCENWLPRMVMSAWRVAGIVHGLEGWDVHECGHTIFGIEKVWEATLQHGFRPLSILA